MLLKNLEGHTSSPQHISYSPPDGQYLALCSWNKTVKIWNAKNGKLLKNLEKHTSNGECISYSPDGKYLASGSSDKTVRIWDVNGRLLQNIKGHTNPVLCISYSPDGQYLASGSYDTTVKIWEKRINPQSKEVIWYLTKEISATESPLVVEDVTIEKAVISAKNQKVFEQKGAKVVNNTIDNTEDKEVSSNEGNTSKKIGNEKPHALLKDKLIAAAEQKALKLVNVKSNFTKEPIRAEDANLSQQPTKEGVKNDKLVVNLISIKYDNPLLNNPILLKKLASNLNINLNKAVDASNYLANLFGSKNFNYICNSDQNLLQELLGNCYEYY